MGSNLHLEQEIAIHFLINNIIEVSHLILLYILLRIQLPFYEIGWKGKYMYISMKNHAYVLQKRKYGHEL